MRAFVAALLVAGCNSSLPAEKPTFHRDVAPLFVAHCQECHQAGGIAEVPALDDYQTARSYAEPIRLAVQTRWMPPWGADDSGTCGSWLDARWLTDQEIATISEWQMDGAPEGEPDAITGATSLPQQFHSDAALDIGGVYQPGLGPGGNRCFVADPGLDRDRLLTAIRVVAQDARAIAQLTLFALDSDAAAAQAAALDDASPGLGYPCFGTARTDDARLVASWTWPTPVLRLPPGIGVRLGAGRKIVVQIHYDIARTGSSFLSGTQVQLELDDHATVAEVVPISADGPLAPGLESVSVETRQPALRRMRVVAIAPRMHIRGKRMTLETEHSCLGSFDHWKFEDEQLFVASHPTTVGANEPLHLSCTYGTLGRTDPVSFGDDIDDEECVAYLFVTE